MKTTLEIANALLRRAGRWAAGCSAACLGIIRAALRHQPGGAGDGVHPPFRLRRDTFGGKGLQAGLDDRDWAAIRERAYEGRSGMPS